MSARIYSRLIATLTAAGSRVRDERGQTAAEYLGVIVVVAAIIAVLVASDLGGTIRDAIEDAIEKITESL